MKQRIVGMVLMVALVGCAADKRATADGPATRPAIARPDLGKVLTRIAFGSCAHQDKPQPIWNSVAAQNPELLILLGDNIYADTTDMALFKAKYDKEAAVPEFDAIRRKVPIVATWDDHDMGANDCGAEYPSKVEAQKLFLEFFHEPADSPRWNREGVYDAYTFGPTGQRVQVILLDTRYFRSALKQLDFRRVYNPKDPKADKDGFIYIPIKNTRYQPDPDPKKTMLGEAQWKWLEEQLRQPADIRILASSIQVAADDHVWEKWENLPMERNRLFDLIKKTKAEGLFVISGDRHRAEICKQDEAIGYTLWDFTGSSFTNPSKPETQNDPSHRRVGNNYIDENFGLITIDWASSSVLVEIKDIKGVTVLKQELELAKFRMP